TPQQTKDAASELLELLTKLLNGELNAKQGGREASSEEELDFSTSLAQLQLLLLQLISAQGNGSSNLDMTGSKQGASGELSTKLGDTANELFQLISTMMQGQTKPSEMKSPILNLLEAIKPMLVQVTALSTSTHGVQVESSLGTGVQ